MLPPLKAIGITRIEVIAPNVGADRWDEAVWDSGLWAEFVWRDITPESMQMQISWGADDPSGVLTVPAAGSWQLDTYDPERKLDPSNGASELRSAIKPGRPIRLVVVSDPNPLLVVREGLIDDIDYDIIAKVGSIRGTDGVSLMVAATMLEGQDTDPNLPNTLRARTRFLISKAGLGHVVHVEDDPVDPETGQPYPDPPVGPLPSGAAALWTHITTSAYDALHGVWVDNLRVLRFRHFGNPIDNGLQIGGDGGMPLSTLKTQASLKNVYTRVVGHDVTTGDTVDVIADDPKAAEVYGEITLHREKLVPNAQAWVDSVLADRSGASLQYVPGVIYPQTFEQLRSLVEAQMVEIVTIIAEKVTPSINIAARLLGGYFRADTGTGWTAGIISYIPAREWEAIEEPPPIEPPIEPPPSTQKVQRIYNATKDTRAARTSGGANYGSGTEGELPVGAWQGWRNRAFIGFASIPFGDVVSVDKCILELDTSDQVNVGFGSSPKVKVQRVTASWSEGSLSSPGSGNSTVYPGPSVTSSGAVTKTVTRSENAAVSIDITAIARAWFSGSAQNGVGIFSSGEDSTTYTTEFWSRENATSGKRPRLVIDMTVRV